LITVALIVGALLPQQAAAFELFGKCLFGQCKNEASEGSSLIDPRRYDVNFQVEGASESVEEQLKAASQLWIGKDEAVAGGAGLIARAKGDYRRILATLYNNARYGGSISIKVNGEEAANIPPGRDIGQSANVTIRVAPGAGYLFGNAKIINAAPPTFDPDDQVNLPSEIGFSSGESADARVVNSAQKLAIEAWKQQGHALATLDTKNAKALHDQRVLDVNILLIPGPIAYYGNVAVEGTRDMDPDFVAYMVGLTPGEEYDPDDLERARRRLDRLGVFSTRKLTEGGTLNANGLLPITLAVQERKLRRIGLGATISSVDGAGAEAYWLHRNLFGKAESLRLDAKLGGVGNTVNPEEFDYLLSAALTQPGLFTPDTDLTWNAFVKQDFNESFKEQSAGLSADVVNYWSKSLTLKGGVFGEYGDFEDAFGNRTFLTTGLRGDVVYDTRNDKLDASRGFYTAFKAQPFYEWEYGNAGVRLEAEGRTYFALDDEKRSILAGRVKVGSLLGPSILETPSNQLFNAGGGNSVRGYAFNSIGLPATNGETTGGKSLFETSVEYRQRFSDSFGAVVFADAGTVGSDSFVDFSEDLKVGVGLGLRYYTGLGPIRLDFAVPLDPGKDDPSFAFYAGIGHAF